METYTFKAETINALVSYLTSRPFVEVAGLIAQLDLEVREQVQTTIGKPEPMKKLSRKEQAFGIKDEAPVQDGQ
jgi:hypothetical protein